MCGIIGIISPKQEAESMTNQILTGLNHLSERGYDSAGLTLIHDNKEVSVRKAVGQLENLQKEVLDNLPQGFSTIGIGHTRWKTHGKLSIEDTHPHTDTAQKIFVVHNGQIENYRELKNGLRSLGIAIESGADTAVIPHLIAQHYSGDLLQAVRKVVPLLHGTYAIAVVHADHPREMVVACYESSLFIGSNSTSRFITSSPPALARMADEFFALESGEIAHLTPTSHTIFPFNQTDAVTRKALDIDLAEQTRDKKGFKHFMLSEISLQGFTLKDTLRGRVLAQEGRVNLGGLQSVTDKLRSIEHMHVLGCGTSLFAGMIGAMMFEEFARLPSVAENASEFQHRSPVIKPNTAFLALSQSGQTADTIGALKEVEHKALLRLGIVNSPGTQIPQITDAGVYQHIGPEVAVASTKAFTSQIAIQALMTVMLGRQRDMSLATAQNLLKELELIPKKVDWILDNLTDQIIEICKRLNARPDGFDHMAILGRKYQYPIALETALKFKEVAYIHAEGWAAGEIKHGPIALVSEKMPFMFLVPEDSVSHKTINNIEQIRSRNGYIIVISTAGLVDQLTPICDELIVIPDSIEPLYPILTSIVIQLMTYYLALDRGLDIDKPRHLAKTVTVD